MTILTVYCFNILSDPTQKYIQYTKKSSLSYSSTKTLFKYTSIPATCSFFPGFVKEWFYAKNVINATANSTSISDKKVLSSYINISPTTCSFFPGFVKEWFYAKNVINATANS